MPENVSGSIKVAPFAVEKFGHAFGLVFDPGDGEEDDDEDPYTCVTVEPGNYMPSARPGRVTMTPEEPGTSDTFAATISMPIRMDSA